MIPFEIRFDDLLINPGFQTGLHFSKPLQIFQAFHKDEFDRNLKDLKSKEMESYWLVGFFTYEAGYVLEEKLTPLLPSNRNLPLFCIGVFENPREFQELRSHPTSIPQIPSFKMGIEFAEYNQAIQKLKEYITAGETYQINLSFPCSFEAKDNPVELYNYLLARQKVSYASFIEYNNIQILSLSPELFLRKDGNQILSKPMKGTAKRSPIATIDDWIKKALPLSPKNQAENLMITDLIRNDLGKFSKMGTVKTKDMFQVESFETVHQMTTTVNAEINPGYHFLDILTGMFPCGSITGAPKIRSMEIIRELENRARGIYTGSIGYIPPKNSKSPAIWNIAIRTITIQGTEASMGIGSGIVMDSDAEEEYLECLTKANFLTSGFAELKEFYILESIPLIRGSLRLSNQHRQRLENTAKYFGIKFDSNKFEILINQSIVKFRESFLQEPNISLNKNISENNNSSENKNISENKILLDIDTLDHSNDSSKEYKEDRFLDRYRFRIALKETGEFAASIQKVNRAKTKLSQDSNEHESKPSQINRLYQTPQPSHLNQKNHLKEQRPCIHLSKTKVNTENPYLYHKTSYRSLYDLEYASRGEYYDIIFQNERGEITESCNQNIFILQNGIYFTPPVTSGLLPGILRNYCLEKFPKIFQEKILYLGDLINNERIVLGNSARGFTQVVLQNLE